VLTSAISFDGSTGLTMQRPAPEEPASVPSANFVCLLPQLPDEFCGPGRDLFHGLRELFRFLLHTPTYIGDLLELASPWRHLALSWRTVT
jgi:hypothetical protein